MFLTILCYLQFQSMPVSLTWDQASQWLNAETDMEFETLEADYCRMRF